MRVTAPGVAAQRAVETFDFEGRPIEAAHGESLGAALLAAGERACRRARSGAPRGLFCGIGVCQDCLVTVDGVPHQLACMTAARGGASVQRQQPFAGSGVPRQGVPEHDESMDVLVIGGGPAGLAAASIAEGRGPCAEGGSSGSSENRLK